LDNISGKNPLCGSNDSRIKTAKVPELSNNPISTMIALLIEMDVMQMVVILIAKRNKSHAINENRASNKTKIAYTQNIS
jgi:hypothetical protein